MTNETSSEHLTPSTQMLKEKLSELIRHASVSRFKIHTACNDVELNELGDGFNPGRILANNMVFALISGDMLRVTFKVHFDIEVAKSLAFRVFGGESAADISRKQATDYFKEYGNLVAGCIVTLFEPMKIGLGMSLPLSTRGFYEVFSDYTEKETPTITFCDFWQLQVPGSTVYCSAAIEILDISGLTPLLAFEIIEDEANDDAEMDFL